jgi:hypothetical protein
MLKRKKKMWNQMNKSRLCCDEKKVLIFLVPFFIAHKEPFSLDKNITRGSVCSELIACFELKIEHENPPRNNAKNKLLNLRIDQQIRRVVSKCSVWW